MAVVTETWLQDGSVENTTVDLAGEHGLDIFTLNRQNVAANGRQYGGVAITTRSSRTTFKKVEMQNPENYEVLSIAGKVRGIREKVVVIAAYLPPNYPRHKALSCLDYVADVVGECKRRFMSPMIVVAGDWNQWPLEAISQDHPDLAEVDHPPTRAGRKIDRFLVNFPRAIVQSDVLPPLDDGMGRESDHLVAFFRAEIERVRDREITYTYRHFSDDGAAKFQQWIKAKDFSPLYEKNEVNAQLEYFLGALEGAMDLCFPLKTTKRRETDPPWINSRVKTIAKKKRRLYHREGRSAGWNDLKKKLADLIKLRAGRYWQHQKKNLLKKDALRAFFKSVKAFNSKEKPTSFHVRSVFEGDPSDGEMAEKLAEHFNGISHEFRGLDPGEIPTTYSAPVPLLTPEMVMVRLKSFRKPKSMVKHDIFPALVNPATPYLAGPLSFIFNTMIETQCWPMKWKEEFVTPIPKKSVPESMNDLRNISCTALFSKVFESFVLGWLLEQVGMRENQLGGMKGAGSEHYLVQLWQMILETLEDPRAASIVTSIDYAKAFNRLDFGCCLRALAEKGASSELLSIVASFLTSRTMSVKVGQAVSKPRIVLGGVPQGSILGVYLFNATIDTFEQASKDVAAYSVVGGRQVTTPPAHDRSLDQQVPIEYDRPGLKPGRRGCWKSSNT